MADANKVAAIKKAIETDGKYKGRKWSPAQLRNMLAMAEGKKLGGGGKRKKGKKAKKTSKKATAKVAKKAATKAARKVSRRKASKKTTRRTKVSKKTTRKVAKKTVKKVAKKTATKKAAKKTRRKSSKKTAAVTKSVIRVLGRHVSKPPKGDMTKRRAKKTVVHVAITADDIIAMSKNYHMKKLICGGRGK